jgi:hypothetical protein
LLVTAEDLRNHPGISGAGLAEMIQQRFGRPMPEGFMQATRAKIMRAFTDELRAIELPLKAKGRRKKPRPF